MCIIWQLWWPSRTLECSAMPRVTLGCSTHFLKHCIGSKRCCCCLFTAGLLALSHIKGIYQKESPLLPFHGWKMKLYPASKEYCGTVCTSIMKLCSVTLSRWCNTFRLGWPLHTEMHWLHKIHLKSRQAWQICLTWTSTEEISFQYY